MRKSQGGFNLVGVLVVLVILGLIGVAGWLVWSKHAHKDTSKQPAAQQTRTTDSVIRFENESSFDAADKQLIIDRIAKPLVVDHAEVLKTPLKEVVIKKNPKPFSPSDARYILNYSYTSDPTNLGFIFGADNKIGYWQPLLCDDGGCKEYPTELKTQFPENYKAYLACKAASDSGDKEKVAELACGM
jgi:type II secretory pathway pseudopilin PulG